MAIAKAALTRALGLAAAAALVAGSWLALGRASDDPLVGQAAPAFSRPLLDDPARAFSPADLRGRVWVLNAWASWCSACRTEHPSLARLANEHGVTLVGLDTRDTPQAARAWLAQLGDPTLGMALDPDGSVARAWGVRGLPETFVIDRAGIVRLRHSGALTPAVLERRVLPAVREWQAR